MSAMATTLSRSPSFRAGLVGAIVGAIIALGIVFALEAFAPQKDRLAIRAVSGPAAVPDVQAALRTHLAREHGGGR